MELNLSLIGQSVEIMNWFTPTWIFSVGVTAGLVLVMLFLGLVYVVAKIPGLNTIAENRVSYFIASLLVSGGLFACCVAALGMLYQEQSLFRFSTEQGPGALLGVLFSGFLSSIVGFGFWRLASKKRIEEVFVLVKEGFLYWFSVIATVLAGFAALGLILGIFGGFGIFKIVDDPRGMLKSLARLPTSGYYPQEILEFPPTPDTEGGTFVPFEQFGKPVTIDGREIQRLRFSSNQNLQVAAEPISIATPLDRFFRIPSTSLNSGVSFNRGLVIPEKEIEGLYIANRGKNPAIVRFDYLVMPQYPEVYLVPVMAVATFSLFAIYLSLLILAPKVTAISISTFKSEVNQPIFLLTMILGAIFVVVSIYIPYNTLGEDIKMYKDSGLTLLKVLAIFVAIWAASKSVAEEIEGRTALTVLSKPVGRRQFIVGKIFGISSAVAILFLILGIWFFFWVSYKPVYDAREMSTEMVEWTTCFRDATHVLPAIFLGFLEVVIFVAISVAISTRLGVTANLMICFFIYVLGHLTPLIVMSEQVAGSLDTVRFFGQFISIIFPVLNHFDVQTAINTNSSVPWIYLGWSVVYTLLYGSAAVLLALVMFEDRDLA
ncbi:MAG: hypothetical protein KF851_16450 [Pirellulaceae bacterium]|nr:hypothetical protein [Pirellulaceae bacterium]